ncbi:copper resistance protein CopD [Sporosarcina thermotolerans]|uniref:Copper resistance protein CopD n=1 Tax=Sporosarcina thermotolerans TaxID=633404 RepID=A0AAW9ABG3_9BACL|nr:copper resistance protein CopD [Sporosarcina thermotolerans]MDW0117544.1 copper resistance protein CopD [Sporosarcina thermotolerans]WHT49705.1 copper resistance protein CopD [Sporosarcina thermotolerans]
MEIVVMISQTLLYVCFAVLAGSFILLLVPSKYRPELKISKRLLLVSAATLPVFAFIPVLDITLFIAPRLGFVEALKIVLTTYTVGTAWDFTLLGSIILVLVIVFARSTETSSLTILGAILTFGLMVTIAWSSHVSTIRPAVGITSHFIHLAAVSIWVGILLIVGWCSANHKNWLAYLSWFSIVAFGCLFATGFSGLLLMDTMVDGYTDSWMVNYGQGLFIKHLFLLPVVFYALVNGFIVKYKITKDAAFNPIPWIRVEGIILFVIFVITAIFSLQAPPHGNYLTADAVSPLFRLFHDGVITAKSTIGFVVNVNTVSLFFISILFFGLMLLSFFKRASIIVSFVFSCLFVMSVYLMFMVTVVIR